MEFGAEMAQNHTEVSIKTKILISRTGIYGCAL